MLCANVKVSAEIYEKIMPNRPRVRDTVLPQARFFFWFQTYNYRKSPLGALSEGGKNSHRRGFAAPPPSVKEASCNHSRKGAAPAPAPCICAYLRFCRMIFGEEERQAL